jgi:hypothetical protein
MAAKNLHIPETLLAELQLKADVQGITVDELAEQALRKGLNEREWQDLLDYGSERGRRSGYSEAEVPGLVKQWREEQRGR